VANWRHIIQDLSKRVYLDDALSDAALRAIVEPLVATVENGSSPASSRFAVPSLNLQIDAELTSVRPAAGRVPDRLGLIAAWPAGGYSPEGILHRLAQRRIRRKLACGQAADAGTQTSVLIVDLSQFAISTERDLDLLPAGLHAVSQDAHRRKSPRARRGCDHRRVGRRPPDARKRILRHF
jgi:hypothetical protein